MDTNFGYFSSLMYQYPYPTKGVSVSYPYSMTRYTTSETKIRGSLILQSTFVEVQGYPKQQLRGKLLFGSLYAGFQDLRDFKESRLYFRDFGDIK